MKEKIQPYEVQGVGIATEALVEIQSRYTTQDKAVIYYDLRDKTQTMDVRVYATGEIVTLPYKIISYQKITVTGDDRASIGADAAFASDIVFRERTDLSVIRGINLSVSTDPGVACNMYMEGAVKAYYLDTEDLSSANIISTTVDMQSPLKEAGFVTDGTNIRYWKGKSFDFKYSGTCKV